MCVDTTHQRMNKETLPIKAVGTSFEVLETVAQFHDPDLETVAANVDVTKSTVYKHLQTLRMLGYIKRSGPAYRLTNEINVLTTNVGGDERRDDARTVVARLASSTGDVAGFFVLQNSRGVVFEQQTGDVLADRGFTIQMTPYLHASAAGKMILASLPPERVASIVDSEGLPALTENTITGEDALYRELDRIENRGVAFEREEQAEGYHGVAAPYRSENDDPIGALYVIGPVDRVGSKRFEQDLPGILLSAEKRFDVSSE